MLFNTRIKHNQQTVYNYIGHLQISHNTPWLGPKILHKHCLQFLLDYYN